MILKFRVLYSSEKFFELRLNTRKYYKRHCPPKSSIIENASFEEKTSFEDVIHRKSLHYGKKRNLKLRTNSKKMFHSEKRFDYGKSII